MQTTQTSKGHTVFVIFGASGNAGRAAATLLRRSGHAVRAAVRAKDSAAELAALGCEIALSDLDDPASVERALRGARGVQVLCPVVSTHQDPAKAMRRMIDIVADALTQARPAHVVAISDYGAELAEGTGITLVFHYLEQRLKRVPAALTFLRSAEHMQNWARVAQAALAIGVLPSFHDPVTKRFPTVAAQDVGHLAAELLMNAPASVDVRRIVNLEGPQRISTQDVARTLAELGGREIASHALPREQWLPALQRAGLSPAHAELVAGVYDAHNAGRIDVEAGRGETRLGTTTLADVLRSILHRKAA